MDGRRVDLRVVPYNVSVLVGYELYRVAIRRERPMCRSVSVECYSYCPKLSHFIGAQSEGSAPHFIPPSVHHLTSLPFLSGSGSEARRETAADKIPLDGILRGSSRKSQHGIWLHPKSVHRKNRIKNPLS